MPSLTFAVLVASAATSLRRLSSRHPARDVNLIDRPVRLATLVNARVRIWAFAAPVPDSTLGRWRSKRAASC